MPAVLVVDDDQQVRHLIATALKRAGYRVLLAADGAQAVASYRQHGGQIALVLLDVLMPEMDGPAAFAELRRLDPAVACCFVSAYAEGAPPAELLAAGALAFVEKPFRIDELVALVRRLADSEAG